MNFHHNLQMVVEHLLLVIIPLSFLYFLPYEIKILLLFQMLLMSLLYLWLFLLYKSLL